MASAISGPVTALRQAINVYTMHREKVLGIIKDSIIVEEQTWPPFAAIHNL
jgi:hypothetical protein